MQFADDLVCICFKSAVVACGVVYAAARRFQVPLPENPPWWKAFDAEKYGIDEVCKVLAHLYSLPKAQYISVCRDGDFSSSNKSSDSQLQPMGHCGLPNDGASIAVVFRWGIVDCLMMEQELPWSGLPANNDSTEAKTAPSGSVESGGSKDLTKVASEMLKEHKKSDDKSKAP
ncbi:hypothetical protein Peur_017204 [Populus x canadensis]